MATSRRRSNVWWGIGALIAIIGGALWYAYSSRPAVAPSPPPSQTTQPAETLQPSAPQAPGTYVAYSAAAFEQASTRRLLFFHAPWCPQCRAIEKDINEQGVPAGMTILKVDYDSSTGLKQEYGVTLQTTFVEVDAGGNLIKKHVGYNEPTLPAVLKAFGE